MDFGNEIKTFFTQYTLLSSIGAVRYLPGVLCQVAAMPIDLVRLILLPFRKLLSNNGGVWSSLEDRGPKQMVKEEHSSIQALSTPEKPRMLLAVGMREANSPLFNYFSAANSLLALTEFLEKTFLETVEEKY